jgi:hypothetical protein
LTAYRLPEFGGSVVDGVVQVALPMGGRYRLVARLLAAAGLVRELAVAPSDVVVGATGGEFAVQVK